MRAFDTKHKYWTSIALESGRPVDEVARELDISANALHGWINKLLDCKFTQKKN